MITAKATKPKKPATKSSFTTGIRSEEHTSELQSQSNLVCRLLLEKKKRTHLHDVHDQNHLGRVALATLRHHLPQPIPLPLPARLYHVQPPLYPIADLYCRSILSHL